MADPQGFLKHRERETHRSRPVSVRILDNREVYERRQEESAVLVQQATRCMDCGVPFCHSGCPLGNLIPEWNELTRREDFATAIERLHATNNFPEFTGKLCPAPCETACVLGINQPAVTIKYIEESIIAEAFDQGLVEPQIPQRLTGRTVAVIGSGPAGLAAAQQLTRAGHTVAVFERDDRIGGLLTYGIPDFKMEKSHVDRRLAQMEAEGTRFRPGIDVGGSGEQAISGEELRERYDAVVLAMGATVPRDLDVPGREFTGVHHAMPYLTQHNRVVAGREVPEQILATGKDVVVIGGGDTGSDCYGTALRQQARSVTQIDINPVADEERPADHPWPTYPRIFRVSTSHEEGGERVFGASTVEFLADETGQVTGIRLVDVIRDKDRNVTPIEGTERVLPADLVLLALGFTGVPAGGLVEQLGIELDERGRLTRDDDYATSVPGVYVAGDAGRGQSLIVWAIAEGRAAAASVDHYLRGEDSELPVPVLPSTAPVSA